MMVDIIYEGKTISLQQFEYWTSRGFQCSLSSARNSTDTSAAYKRSTKHHRTKLVVQWDMVLVEKNEANGW